MELRILEYFLAVAREQSISAAARSLHLSQPTLSRQLRELEAELGKHLMIRGNRRITLTEEGLLLQKRAEEIVLLAGKVRKEISLEGEQLSGSVMIGAGETEAMRLLARAARNLQAQHPRAAFHVVSGDTPDIVRQLESGLIDFALLFDPVDMTRFDFLPLPVRDRWGVLMRSDDPLARQEYITLEQLQPLPLIVSRLTDDNSQLFRERGMKVSDFHVAATYNLLFNASLMVEEGIGYALALEGIINTDGRPLRFLPFKPISEAGLNIVWKKYQMLSRVSEKFLQEVKKILEEKSDWN